MQEPQQEAIATGQLEKATTKGINTLIHRHINEEDNCMFTHVNSMMRDQLFNIHQNLHWLRGQDCNVIGIR